MLKMWLKIIPPLHIKLYRRTGGLIGGRLGKVRMLLLTTTGRKSGLQRTSPLLFIDEDHPDHPGAYIIVASKGGAPKNPAWYLNLTANPTVTVENGRAAQQMVAETISEDDWERIWPQLVANWSDYAAYQKKTDRRIPVVRLTPAAA